ncbi:hypothetical protein [Klebsiella aerogenes]|uniref:hypothetical protein n=1 Tax=Klebsiella aerogenes TaxID=548 RepID=UPI001906C872|nr:hypothetical protein [Klebsiella aerogenes]MBK0469653.1 hypothetical protein [Klebsiella aerogenes]
MFFYMVPEKKINQLVIVLFIFLLSGCGLLNKTEKSPLDKRDMRHSEAQVNNMYISQVKDITQGKEAVSHLAQCNRDLESLRTVSQTEYRRYAAEYDALLKSSASFMTVKDDVSPEVAALARPKFQFALVNLCYRIKDALARTLINQAGGR